MQLREPERQDQCFTYIGMARTLTVEMDVVVAVLETTH